MQIDTLATAEEVATGARSRLYRLLPTASCTPIRPSSRRSRRASIGMR